MKKFDFVIGNPPYQEETTTVSPKGNGQIRTKNIFPYFQEVADRISNNASVLIFPGARWIHRSGKGTVKFGLSQINDKRLSHLVFYPNSNEVFEGVDIYDGVSIVVKDMKKTNEGFKYSYIKNGDKISKNVKNPGEDLMPLDPKDIDIVSKIGLLIEKNGLSYLHERILSQKFFGIESNFIELNKGKSKPLSEVKEINYDTQVKLFANDRAGKAGRSKWFVVNKDLIPKNEEYISEWQVVVSSASAGGQKRDNQIDIIDNHSAFGRSRVALGTFKTEKEAQNFLCYCNSNIIKYSFLMTDENLSSLAKRVPDIMNYKDDNNLLDYSKSIDEQLKTMIGLNENEYEHIVNKVQSLRRKQ